VTPEIALVLSILAVAIVFLITEWIPLEVTALLSLGAVALTGLVNPVEALAGFSNPAVITVWAVFILSGGLTRTGVANTIGHFVLRLAGHSETRMIVVIMITGGVMSAIMNNVDASGGNGYCPPYGICAFKASDAVGLRFFVRRSNHSDRNPSEHPGQRCPA
jgi:di/tricarboxylate transporter